MKILSKPLQLSEPLLPFNLAAAASIENQEQLTALSPAIKGLLIDDYKISSLADRLLPVERINGVVSIFARQEYVGSDQADALEQMILASGKKLSQPSRFILPAGLLLALARSKVSYLPMNTGLTRTTSALAGVFHDLVQWAVNQNATDIHINICTDRPISEVCFTVAGRYIRPARFNNMPTSLLRDVLAVAWMDIQGGNGAVFDPNIEQQGSLLHQVNGNYYVLRWASLAADLGPSVCLRVLARDKTELNSSLEKLGYNPQHINIFRRILLSDGGAIVFAGTVGSGKSTTLASLLNMLPQHRKVISIEEPIEYRIKGAIQNSIGRDLTEVADKQYAAKLRTIKRSAMTDVLLGEVRDRDSGLAFMDLAGSGVNVYTTIHAPAAHAITKRLTSEFIGIPSDFLSTPGILKLLVYQALLPELCPNCALANHHKNLNHPIDNSNNYWEQWLGWIAKYWHIDIKQLRFRNPAGCNGCYEPQLPQFAGYIGRTVVAEMIEPALQPNTAKQPPNLASSSALADAMQKAAMGRLDVRDIEARFMAMQTLHLAYSNLSRPG